MLSKKSNIVGSIVISLFFFLFVLECSYAENTTSQIINHIDEILKANPLKEGEKFQLINIAQADTVALSVVRFTEGFGPKHTSINHMMKQHTS